MWVCKDRQLGLTELLICWMLYRSTGNPAYAGAVFSITEKDAHKVSKRIERMPSQIPDFAWEIDNIGVRKAIGGGELNFRPSTSNATRGLESVWDLFFDESGFIPIIDEMYAASTPSQEMVGEDARTFIVSTIPPEGRNCWYWERGEDGNPSDIDIEQMLQVARSGEFFNRTRVDIAPIPGFCAWEDDGGWVKVIIGHKAHPIYGSNPNYVEEKRIKKKITQAEAEREHNLGLPKDGGSLFNLEAIARNKVGSWQEPRANHFYLLCIDPNFGGSDPFVAQVWDITSIPYSLVAQYRESDRSTAYSRGRVRELGDRYAPVLVAIESNSGGTTIAENLMSDRPDWRIELVKTTASSKKVNTDRIALALEQDEVIYPDDWHGIREMQRFSATRREGMNETDDCIMSWAAGWAWLDTAVELIESRRPGAWGVSSAGWSH